MVAGARTPFGKYGGSLSRIRIDDLQGLSIAAACERAGLPPDRIDDIAAGGVNTAHGGMSDVARWAALAAQLDGFEVPDDRLNLHGGAVATSAIRSGRRGPATCSRWPSR